MPGVVLYDFRLTKPAKGNLDFRISSVPTGGFAWGVVEVWHWEGQVDEKVLAGGFAPSEELAFAAGLDSFRQAMAMRKG